jgi:DnaJ-domain-containing protein 1
VTQQNPASPVAPDKPAAERYWIRNEVGRVWGPFGIDAVGRVNVGSGEIADRILVSTDGQSFLPIREFPEVLEQMERGSKPAPRMRPMPDGPAPVRHATFQATAPLRSTPIGPPTRSNPNAARVEVPPPPPPQRPRTTTTAPVENPGPPLEGELEAVSAAQIYSRVAGVLLTGKLTVHAKDGTYGIFFKKGTPERVETPDPGGALVEFLIRRGAAPADALQQALQQAGGPAADLAGSLYSLGLIPPQNLFPLLGEQGVEQLFRVLSIDAGHFVWSVGVPPPAGSFALGQRWELLCHWARRLPRVNIRLRLGDRMLRAAYPSSGTRASLEDLRLTAQESRVAAAFDGTQSADQLGHEVFHDPDLVYRTALLLAEVGFLSFGPALRPANKAMEAATPAPAKADAPVIPEPPPLAEPVAAAEEDLPPLEPEAPPAKPPPPVETAPSPRPGSSTRPAPPPRPPPVVAQAPAGVRPSPPPAAAPKPPSKPPPSKPPTSNPPASGAKPSSKPPARVLTSPHRVDSKANDPERLRALLASWQTMNHFKVLGVPETANAQEIKNAYLVLARQYHPDTVTDPAQKELRELKEQLIARVNDAYQVLSETQSRVKYIAELQEGGKVDVMPILEAEEEFLRATILVKARKMAEAIELLDHAMKLNPNEQEFKVWRAYAQFSSSPDKSIFYNSAMAECARVAREMPACVAAFLFMGHMAKQMGETAKAERHFRQVVELEPGNIEARRELRAAGKSS